MSITTAVVLSLFLLTVTGCAASGDSSATKQEAGNKDSPKKTMKHDEEKAMNEQSQNSIMGR